MTITTNRVTELPAVTCTYDGHITAEDVRQMYEDTAYLLADVPGYIYRVNDLCQSDTDIREFVRILRIVKDRAPYHAGDPLLTVIFVGMNRWSINISSGIGYKGPQLQIFDTLEQAHTFIEQDVTTRARF